MHDITRFTGYRTKTTCQNYYEPASIDELCYIVQSVGESLYTILAGGWNTVMSRSHYSEIQFITTCNLDNKIVIEGDILEAGCAALLSDVCTAAANNGLSGLENLVGIPSTIGGAVAMNAGAFGTEVADVLFSVELVDVRFGEVFWSDLAGCRFYKRGCGITSGGHTVITRARFKLKAEPSENIVGKMHEILSRRSEKYPSEPNCGSVFVSNRNSEPASLIIDKLGLKGFEIGGAKVSDKHAGFVVSAKPEVTGDNVVGLIKVVQQRLFVHTGNYYPIEQRII